MHGETTGGMVGQTPTISRCPAQKAYILDI